VLIANKNISFSYDATSIVDGISQALYDFSCADKTITKISLVTWGQWCAQGPGSQVSPMCLLLNPAQHCSPVQILQLPIRLLVTVTSYTKTTLHTVMT